MGQVLAVISGKGGTGKTTVCAAVAASLAAQGQKVLCMDADIGLRNLDISLGMTELSALSFTDVLSGHYGLQDATPHPTIDGLFLLTAPIRQRAEEIDFAAFTALLGDIRQEFDWCLIDAAAGVGAGLQLATCGADQILVVANADPASLRDAAYAAGLLAPRFDSKMHLVVNRVSPKLMSRMALTIDDVMDGVGLPLIGLVPEDANVLLSAAEGIALPRKTRRGASRACFNIASRLRGQRVRLMRFS